MDEQTVTEWSFRAQADSRDVPGTLWLPTAGSGPVPLVLIGHGGSQHKGSAGPRELAELLVRDHGFAAAAIDGPVHGERRPDGGSDPAAVFADHRADIEQPGSLATMAADWQAALDLLQEMSDWTVGPVGYWGLSMGTLYGLPFLAREDRVQAAVLGLWGSAGTAPDTWAGLASAASAVRCPLLFLAQMEDQLFRRPACLSCSLGSRPGTSGCTSTSGSTGKFQRTSMQSQSGSSWTGSDSRLPQCEEGAFLVLAHARRRWRYSRVSCSARCAQAYASR